MCLSLTVDRQVWFLFSIFFNQNRSSSLLHEQASRLKNSCLSPQTHNFNTYFFFALYHTIHSKKKISYMMVDNVNKPIAQQNTISKHTVWMSNTKAYQYFNVHLCAMWINLAQSSYQAFAYYSECGLWTPIVSKSIFQYIGQTTMHDDSQLYWLHFHYYCCSDSIALHCIALVRNAQVLESRSHSCSQQTTYRMEKHH